MNEWWRRNDFYLEYMLHEGTALFVAAYAFILLIGLLRLAQGPVAWNAWVDALRSPLSVAFHVIVLIALCYHTWTWFHIMPRTLPPITVAGKRVAAKTIVRTGLAAAVVVSMLVFGLVWGIWK
jgi:fumarate reductase subunit C